MQQVLALVDSPDKIIADAARDSLSEFSFEKLLGSFDLLDEEVAGNTGQLVRKIDREATRKLAAEFESPSRTRRLRAIALAVAMGLVSEVETALIAMLSDEDHFIRADAARALGNASSAAARNALRDLLTDASPSVREAAEHALQMMVAQASVPPPTDLSRITEGLMQLTRESLR
jgi:HEAT repeat protein